MRILKLLKLAPLVLWLSCGNDVTAPKHIPPINIAGAWQLTGQVDYGCADTLRFTITQQDSIITSPQGIWRFQCGSTPYDSTLIPILHMEGRVRKDSVLMAWSTDSTFVQCPNCGIFGMQGVGDSLHLAGKYQDFLGGNGDWIMIRQ